MISAFISRIVILTLGTLYPAYASYKAVRTKDVKEYVRWMMYWIVFALFNATETLTDLFVSFWFPFYYELKIVIVLWLLSPITKGSSIMYRSVIHPWFTKREQEIDGYIAKAKEQGYSAFMEFGTKGVNLATNVIVNTALKGGGNLFIQLRKSYSLNDLSSNNVDNFDNSGKKQSNSSLVDNEPLYEKRLVSAGSQVDLRDIGTPNREHGGRYFENDNTDCVANNLRSRTKRNVSRQDVKESSSAHSPKNVPEITYGPPLYPTSSFSILPNELLRSNLMKWNKFMNIHPHSSPFSNEPNLVKNKLNPKLKFEFRLKSNSSPDLPTDFVQNKNLKKNYKIVPSTSLLQVPCEEYKGRKRMRKKRRAPSPPKNVPVIEIEGDSETMDEGSSSVSTWSLASSSSSIRKSTYEINYMVGKTKKKKTKFRRILSKSREMLTVFRNDNDDSSDNASVTSRIGYFKRGLF